MRDESRRAEVTPWDAPAKATPLAEIEAVKRSAAASGVPIDSPEAFAGVAELLDDEGRRTGILIRRED